MPASLGFDSCATQFSFFPCVACLCPHVPRRPPLLSFAEFVSLSSTNSVLSLLLGSSAGGISDKPAEQTLFKNISVCYLLYFCMLHVCGFHRPEQGDVPGAGDRGDSELPSVGAGELNLGPLEEQVSALNC